MYEVSPRTPSSTPSVTVNGDQTPPPVPPRAPIITSSETVVVETSVPGNLSSTARLQAPPMMVQPTGGQVLKTNPTTPPTVYCLQYSSGGAVDAPTPIPESPNILLLWQRSSHAPERNEPSGSTASDYSERQEPPSALQL